MKSVWRTLGELFEVLPRGAKPFYIWYSIVTGLLSLLDALAMALIAIAITPMVSGKPIRLPVWGVVPFDYAPWLLLFICALFVVKGVFAVALHWYATRRFARYELEVGNQLFTAFVHSSWEKRASVSTAEVTRIIDSSMMYTNMQFIMPLSQIPGNALTFIGVAAVLVIAQPLTALISIVYLGLITSIMVLVVTRKAQRAGYANRDYTYSAATVMTEMVEALKEITLRNKLGQAGEVVSEHRQVATRARADLSFYGIVPRYAFDAALIGGFLLIGGASYLMGGFQAAFVSVALFGATGFRMIPAMNAVQGGITTASSSEVFVRDVIDSLREAEVKDVSTDVKQDSAVLPVHPHLIRVENVSFSYPDSERPVLDGVSIDVPVGSRVAIVGPSGSGKSTLIDIILGLRQPGSGRISVDGIDVADVLHQWRAHIGYVQQRVAVFDGSIAQNVALTWRDDFDRDKVWRVLEQAQLTGITDRAHGLDQKLGEHGVSISGGQQQRLGIARALYTDPLILVLDEATSALDTNTETLVMEEMRELAGQVTFVTIAHRLATVRDYDKICYLDQGKILAQGSFEEVMQAVPDFKHQAQLAGLVHAGDEGEVKGVEG